MTKDEMEKKIAELNDEMESLKEAARTANAEMRRFQSDANRFERDYNEVHEKLKAIRTVVNVALLVDYGVGVHPTSTYIDVDRVVRDNDCREVRLLRHIHELSETRPPF